ncbi:5-formyltetrahydrofolate cyclo-ligase [Falsirhodobacter algicola]|uniref:5-formyltetrahydrofolate cyclo-ligase n=1 Tax=Falsirhodobacter algicola TaxID=2692330 RepID=A0A8J8SK71_9RHOB|nr:5-formyltetrahydrofolate cyclo-ligase [Falsirhodobacter algicola]QUS35052.1 5-formyltetrahydrofolate cyclo-ligase [Falsirhodobacter algicola]
MKAELRHQALAARGIAHGAGQGAAAAHLADWLAPHAGRVLAGYLPLRTEIDPRAAMAAHDGPVCVPVIEAAGLPLRFRRWTQDTPLEHGPFGVMIPATGDWLEPEVVIVPLVAFDASGYRLGYGGGFYDRTLERLRQRGPVVAVGFAFAAQQWPAVPVEVTDQPLDAVITELGLTTF